MPFMAAVASVFRAAFGYCFLIFIVRIVGRRPGKQITPFDFVLIFYLGGLTLTGMVSDEISLTNALCQIVTIALCHYGIALARARWPRVARILDGTPLVLLEHKQWRTETLQGMRVTDEDVMAVARGAGLRTLEEIDTAVLERNGEINVTAKSMYWRRSKDMANTLKLDRDGTAPPPPETPMKPVGDSVAKVDDRSRWERT